MFITKIGLQTLNNELLALAVAIEDNKKDIERARAYGDLSENAEYVIAKENKRILTSKKIALQKILAESVVLQFNDIKDPTKAYFGAEITVENEDEKVFVYKIVSAYESDVKNNKIAVNSPIAKAVMNKKVGDFFTVETPVKEIEYKLIKVSYDWLI